MSELQITLKITTKLADKGDAIIIMNTIDYENKNFVFWTSYDWEV